MFILSYRNGNNKLHYYTLYYNNAHSAGGECTLIQIKKVVVLSFKTTQYTTI